MHVEKRVRDWEEWSYRLRKLANEVELAMEDYAPYGRVPDKDAPAVEELYDMLETVSNFASERLSDAEKDESLWEDAWDMYRAWEVGLCPKVMKEYREHQRYESDAGNTYFWPEIAKNLHESEMSQVDTENAVLAWEYEKREAV